MDNISLFMRQQYAQKLGVSIEEVIELYDFVQEHFFISVNRLPAFPSENPKQFYARLWFKDEEDAYILKEFEAHESPFLALEIGLEQVLHTKLSKSFLPIPSNILILFDINRERKRITNESWYFVD